MPTKPPPKPTPTNLHSLARLFDLGRLDRVSSRVESTSAPHIRRCINAGLARATDDGRELELTDAGRIEVAKIREEEEVSEARYPRRPEPGFMSTAQFVDALEAWSERCRRAVEFSAERFGVDSSEHRSAVRLAKEAAEEAASRRAKLPRGKLSLVEPAEALPEATVEAVEKSIVAEEQATTKRKRRRGPAKFGRMTPQEAARKGGLARAAKLSAAEKSAIGRKGMLAACKSIGVGGDRAETGYRGAQCGYVLTPKGKEAACYAVRPLASLITSHDPRTWRADERYPALVQERDYMGDPNEQAKVGRIAKAPDPAVLLNNSPTAVDGPPVVSSGGYVLGGNGRTMGLRLAYELGTAGPYVAQLEERAPIFGLTKAQVREVTDPVLVRVVPSLDGASQQQLADASSRLNEGLTGSLDERAKGVAVSRRLTQNTIEVLATLLEEHETLRKAMSADGRRIVASLRADGIITPQNAAALVGADGGLTEAGKMLLEGAFLGLVAGTPERLNAASASTLQRLERLVPYLVQVRAVHPEADAIPTFQGALDLLQKADSAGMSLDQLMAQGDLFSPSSSLLDKAPPPGAGLPQSSGTQAADDKGQTMDLRELSGFDADAWRAKFAKAATPGAPIDGSFTIHNSSSGTYGPLSIDVSLPPLRGSEKQVVWANKIRVVAIRTILDKFTESPAAVERLKSTTNLDARLAAISTAAASHVEAKWWIDRRDPIVSGPAIAAEAQAAMKSAGTL